MRSKRNRQRNLESVDFKEHYLIISTNGKGLVQFTREFEETTMITAMVMVIDHCPEMLHILSKVILISSKQNV